MRIVDFPTPSDPAVAELEAALFGDAEGPAADSWRELRADVRALAEPIDLSFEERLASSFGDLDRARSKRPLTSSRGFQALLARRGLLTGLAAALAVVVLGIVIAAPFSGHGRGPVGASRRPTVNDSVSPRVGFDDSAPAATQAPDVVASPVAGSSSAAATRVQELAASITLGTSAGEVQQVADGVGRLVTSEGGFVERSQVEQSGRDGEATLQLSVPSARLSRTLAALARLAPVRAESQSLQDITSSYDAAKRSLSDAVAERAALLRALAEASTQGKIESLHRRLALAGAAIVRARSKLGGLSRRAANSNVAVTVLANGQSGDEGLTLRRGLHDAGRVLTVTLIVAVVGLAGLIPLLAVLCLLAIALRRLRRELRERALS